jgi:hypothetical protein
MTDAALSERGADGFTDALRAGECFPAGLSESAYKTADFPSNLNCYAAFSARTTASATFFAERGFCPVIRRPSTSTCERSGSPFVFVPKAI